MVLEWKSRQGSRKWAKHWKQSRRWWHLFWVFGRAASDTAERTENGLKPSLTWGKVVLITFFSSNITAKRQKACVLRLCLVKSNRTLDSYS
jgi:hypothetical protein